MRKIYFVNLTVLMLVIASVCSSVFAQTSVFTYQGKLTDSSSPANGQYDFTFRLFDAASSGTQIGTDIFLDNVTVSGGIFTVNLDFGSAAFTNSASRFLEISVRTGASTGAFTLLNPRQQITSAPFAIQTLNANSADSLSTSCSSCATDAQIQSVDGNKITGTVANAVTANNVSGVVQIANGGTGSSTKNFVDLSTNQTNIGGDKTFTGVLSGNGSGLTNVAGTLKWQTVAGQSLQAQSNNGYLTSNDAEQVAITLPATPNIGDIVRVSSLGAGGWKIVQNDGQWIIASNISNIDVFGATWSQRKILGSWISVASSSDGNKLVAANDFGQIYASTNAGVTWTPRDKNREWSSVASSADGSKLVAAVRGGQIYTSTDSGISWTPREINRNWVSVASSADGNKLVAVVDIGRIYISSDSGVTWTQRDTFREWISVASSADGTKLVAAEEGGQIYTSSNSGGFWTPRGNNRNWISVASSSDGSKLVAAVSNGQIYTSTDSGETWTPRETERRWTSVTSSANGNRLVAVVRNDQIYTSADSGVTWTPRDRNRNWTSVASSADGSKLVAVENFGYIYTSLPSTSIGKAGYLTGGQFTSIELQYIGNGQFFPLSYIGSLNGN